VTRSHAKILELTVPPCSIWQRVVDKEYSAIGIESELTDYVLLLLLPLPVMLFYRRPSRLS
jgi:hypothetical protein